MKRETPNATRGQIVEANANGSTAVEIARVLGVKKTTVHEIINVYKAEGRIDKKQRGGERTKKLNDEREAIKAWIDEDCSITLQAIKERCLQDFGISVSIRTIAKTIDSFHYSIKRVHVQPARRNDEQALDDRAEYAIRFMQLFTSQQERHFIFIDEVGFCVSMRARRGRSLIGSPAVHVAPSLRSRNISICCAITNQRMLMFQSETRPFNRIFFGVFLQSLFVKLRDEGLDGAILVLDNVAFHRSAEIRTLIAGSGHELLFLPPYSPFLNPIENWFSKWKNFVRQSRPQNETNLFELIGSGAQILTASDCNNYFRHMLGYLSRCLARLTIDD